jgi:hypothetical protein
LFYHQEALNGYQPKEMNFTVVKSMRTITVKIKRNSLSIFLGVIF